MLNHDDLRNIHLAKILSSNSMLKKNSDLYRSSIQFI